MLNVKLCGFFGESSQIRVKMKNTLKPGDILPCGCDLGSSNISVCTVFDDQTRNKS